MGQEQSWLRFGALVAWADGVLDESERKTLVGVVRRQFGLSSEQVATVLDECGKASAEFVDEVIRGLEAPTPMDALERLAMCYTIAVADQRLDPPEEVLLRRAIEKLLGAGAVEPALRWLASHDEADRLLTDVLEKVHNIELLRPRRV